jgi:FecR-like protein
MSGTKIFSMAAALLCAALPAVAAAQAEESAGIVTTVNGDATLIRAVAAARPVSLQMRDEIFVRDRIHTQQHSLVRVLLGGKALITVRELSVLTVTEEAGRVTVDLQSGKIGVAVVKGRMRPGEVIEIRSPNATAAVRGTVFVVEVDPIKAGEATPVTTTHIHLFHGALDVSAHLDPSKATVRLAELQSVVVTGNALGSVRPLSRDAVATLTADLKPKQMQTNDTPDEFKTPLMAREQGRAIQLATALLPPVAGGAPVSVTVTGVTGTASNLTDATAETLDGLMDTLGLGDTLTNTVGGLGNTLTNTVGGLGGSVGSLGGSVSGLSGAGSGSLGGTASSLGGTVGSLGGTVGSLGGTVGSLSGTVGGTVGGVGGTVGSAGGTVGGVLGGLGGLLGGGR